MTDKPCNQCQNYDVIKTGKGDTKRGWCAKKSVYAYKEGPGQIFPRGVARAAPGELATPFIVKGSEIQTTCNEFVVKITKKK